MTFGFSRLALPLYDADDALGAGAPDTDSDDGSLSDHEAAFGAGATRESAEPASDDGEPEPEPAADTRERNPDGTFTKPRHRAKSQQATPEDSPRISELTRKRHEAEARAEAAERRAEEAERRASGRRDDEPAKPEPAKPERAKFPAFEVWQAQPGNAERDWYDYSDAREDFRYEARRTAEKATEAAAADAKEFRDLVTGYTDKIAAFVKTRPDFHDIVSGERAQTSKVVERAVIAVGPEAAYYLATHDEDRLALTEDTLYVHPDNPAFKAAVAATRRYLSTLVASQRSTPTRAAAGSTGAARASLAPPAPKPPTLVRTGATRDAEETPGDEGSLADHEKAFGPKRRRA